MEIFKRGKLTSKISVLQKKTSKVVRGMKLGLLGYVENHFDLLLFIGIFSLFSLFYSCVYRCVTFTLVRIGHGYLFHATVFCDLHI